jgi:hypothetical protein
MVHGGVRPTEVADAWYTPLIETTKMNTELDNNNGGVKRKTPKPGSPENNKTLVVKNWGTPRNQVYIQFYTQFHTQCT